MFMRYILFYVWLAVTAILLFYAVSDGAFGTSGFKAMAKRVALALAWPVAVLSAAGRKILFSNASGM
jgi:hypothetical protein